MNTNRQWLLAKRPAWHGREDNFEYREVPIPEPGEGQVLVRNLYLSFDPDSARLDGRRRELSAPRRHW